MLEKSIILLFSFVLIALLGACGGGISGTQITSSDVTNVLKNKPNYTCDTSDPNTRIPNLITTDYSIGPGCFYSNEYVIVTSGAQLTVQPNTILQFSSSVGLAVDNGSIVANGTASRPIYFTSEFNNRNNSWVGIEITARDSIGFRPNSFKYTVIEYAGANRPQLNNTSASISFYDSLSNGKTQKPRITFSHNIIRKSSGEFALLAAENTFFDKVENNIFYDNYNYPVSVDVNESFKFNNTNKFTYNNLPNLKNKIFITGSKLNVTTNPESQEISDDGFAQLQTNFFWQNLNVPFFIQEDIVIQSTSLNITAGTQLEFTENAGLSIYGNDASLTINGTATQPVVLTSTEPTNNQIIEPNWLGLHFDQSSNSRNSVKYAQISNAGGVRDGANINSNIAITNFSSVEINNSILSNSLGFGLHLDDTSNLINFNDNQLIENQIGIAKVSILKADFLTANNTYGNSFSNTIQDTISLIPQPLTSNHTINSLDVPYLIESSRLTVTGNLTIEAGTTLLFRDFSLFSIESRGTLVAEGTELKPIIFGLKSRFEDPTSQGFWQGLIFSNTPEPRNFLSYVTIDYAGHNQAPITLSFNSSVSIDNTFIQNISPNSVNSIDVRDSSSVTLGNGNYLELPTNMAFQN